MTLHFAYGSNMHRGDMRQRCPHAQALGVATLRNWRFVITHDGYASIVPRAGSTVHGVVWRLSRRDEAVLDAYEDLASGLYRRVIAPVRYGDTLAQAMIYLARERPEGRPRPGYMEAVLDAARDWDLPADYLGELERWISRAAAIEQAVEAT
jgi:gamma-glutamylcyclotransferase (GGCT)/AIG2-like uncharacterized protein YtfP